MKAVAHFALLTILVCLIQAPRMAWAGGHGPVFGLATPTNSKGEWSFDFAAFGRTGAGGSEVGTRSMITYGFTPHLQLSFAAPGLLSVAPLPPSQSMNGEDFTSTLGWRFHHNASKVGTRFESTVFAGLTEPGVQRAGGVMGQLRRAPGIFSEIATGMASRSHYVWGGIGGTRYFQAGGDRRPDVLSYSLVYGYRPFPLRQDYPHWDWRVFAEMTGENWGRTRHFDVLMPGTAGQQLLLGPTTLGIYKNFAIEGGVQFPIYRAGGSAFARERTRYAINVSYFLFTNHGSH